MDAASCHLLKRPVDVVAADGDDRVAGLELPRVDFVDLNEDKTTRRRITMISARLTLQKWSGS